MLIEYLYRKSIGARGGGGDLHKNPRFVKRSKCVGFSYHHHTKTRYVLPVPIRARNNMCPCRFGHTL